MEVKKYSPLNSLKKIADNLWIVDGEEVLMNFKLFKVPFSTRMTVIRLQNGGLWVHSPIKPSDNLLFEIKQLGEVKHHSPPTRQQGAMLQVVAARTVYDFIEIVHFTLSSACLFWHRLRLPLHLP